MNELFSAGSKKPLEEGDIPKQPVVDTCDPINEKFERYLCSFGLYVDKD